jgi:hypothetical protein
MGLIAGCGPSASVHLVQPQLRGFERVMHLTSDRAHWADGESVERVLAEFPLPGARRGEGVYLLYLRVPAGVQSPPVGGQDPKSARGFFIQTKGEHHGLALIASGELEVSGTGHGRDSSRVLDLALTLEDGTRIKGRVHATRDDWHVEQFETRQRAADVKALGG